MKARCNKCYTQLRQREIALSNYFQMPVELCSDCFAIYFEEQTRKVDQCI
jgi:hypothetical protein